MDKINKLSLPATIIIACIIFGGFLYKIQVEKIDFEVRQAWGRCVSDDFLNGENLLCKSLYPAGYKAWSDNFYE